MLFYVDNGNPTSGPRAYNPFRRGWPQNNFTKTHVATTFTQLAASWGPDTCNMWKLWFDRVDVRISSFSIQVLCWHYKCDDVFRLKTDEFIYIGLGLAYG